MGGTLKPTFGYLPLYKFIQKLSWWGHTKILQGPKISDSKWQWAVCKMPHLNRLYDIPKECCVCVSIMDYNY